MYLLILIYRLSRIASPRSSFAVALMAGYVAAVYTGDLGVSMQGLVGVIGE